MPIILPYESTIFLAVQDGNIGSVRTSLASGMSSIYAVDPYGLGLLYVSSINIRVKCVKSDFLSSTQHIIAGEAADRQ